MEKTNLLASVTLFSELYNSKKYTGISSIISEFIKGAVVYEKKFEYTSYQLSKLLEKIYSFKIPESVIRYVLHTNLKGSVNLDRNVFYFDKSIVSEFPDIHREIEEKSIIQNKVFSGLVSYVSEKEKRELTPQELTELFSNFNHFLYDKGANQKFFNHISAYIIQHEANHDFITTINLIREGLILYQGIKYTANVDELGKWSTELVIYLNTEYLFNALGYNGILYQEIFNDFYRLVTEINSVPEGEEKKEIVKLRYFTEVKDEVDSIFYTAESIKKGFKRLNPWRTAVKEIVDSCGTPSDIVAKKVKFYADLEEMKILHHEYDYDVIENAEFNIEDSSVIDNLKQEAKEKCRDFDEESCGRFIKMFTNINILRNGNNNQPFDNIGYIFITDSSFGKYLGHNNKIKFSDYDNSFAKDIDFVTAKFWFKLKKGFSDNQSLPKSFDVLTKARIILASHLNSACPSVFDKLVNETNEGKLSKKEALARSYALREKPCKPEEINTENVDSAFEFLNNEEYLDDFYRETERKDDLLRETQRQIEDLRAELQRRDRVLADEEAKREKQKYNAEKIKFVAQGYASVKKRRFENLWILFLVILLNLFVVVAPLLFTLITVLKEWLIKFGFFQLICVIVYALIILSEALGYKYIFNKTKIKDGWLWLGVIISKERSKEFYASVSTELGNEFDKAKSAGN